MENSSLSFIELVDKMAIYEVQGLAVQTKDKIVDLNID